MSWTKKEKELIAILEQFIDNCARSNKFKNINRYRLLERILAETKGEIAATKQYCQQILNSETNETFTKQNGSRCS